MELGIAAVLCVKIYTLTHPIYLSQDEIINRLTAHVYRYVSGAFRVEMNRQSQKDRIIMCRYDPREPGDYVINIKWSGENVPRSPFHVHIAESAEELQRYKRQLNSQLGGGVSNANGGGLHNDYD